MAIPPVISGLPIFNLLKSDKTGAAAPAQKPAASQDRLEISEAAQKKFAESRKISSSEASDTARKTGGILRETDVSLTDDPSALPQG